MNTFKQVAAILKKDTRSLLWLALLTTAMIITKVLITDLKALEFTSSLIRTVIPYISFLTSAILLVAVIQIDPAASLIHDWLTRPIPKRELITAKLLFIVIFIILPSIATRFFVNVANGLPIGVSLSAATIVPSNWILLAFSALLCVAIISRSALQAAGILLGSLVFLAIVATVVPLIASTDSVGSERTFISTFWISAAVLTIFTIVALSLIPWLQYSKRNFKSAFIFFIVILFLDTLAIFSPFTAPTWPLIFSLHKMTVNGSSNDVSNALKLDFAESCFPASYISARSNNADETTQSGNAGAVPNQIIGLAWSDGQLDKAGAKAIAFSTTVIGRGIPLHHRYIVLKASADFRSESLQNPLTLIPSGASVATRIDRFGSSATHYWLVPETLVEKLGSDPTTELAVHLDIALLAPITYELEMDDVHRYFPKLGYCKALRDDFANRVEINCFKRGTQPALISAELDGVPASRVDANTPNYTPGWLEFWNGKSYELTLTSPSLVKSDKILLRAYDAVDFIQRDKTLAGFLGESNDRCPLPQESNYTQFSWSDPSPHRSSFIAVDEGVRLEILDWGGPDDLSGEIVKTLVLLPGAGATAHSYDEIAPILAKHYRVIGITRRGFGASSKPDFGYDVDRLALDVVNIIDSLNIKSPILVGHSFGGEELSAIAADYSGKASGLIYLDAAYDRASYQDRDEETALIRSFPPAPRPSRADLASYDAIKKYMDLHNLDHLPPGELMASYDMASGSRKIDPRIGNALMAGVKRPEYEKINVPALAIYAVATSSKSLIKPWFDLTEQGLIENVEQLYKKRGRLQREQITNFQQSVANAQVLELEDADHWVVVSNPTEVVEAITTFVTNIETTDSE